MFGISKSFMGMIPSGISRYQNIDVLFKSISGRQFCVAASSEEAARTDKVTDASALDQFGRVYGTGRRKTSVARVWIREGSGQFFINNKRSIDYFQPLPREHCIEPFIASGTVGLFDVWCTVKGGGTSGQAGAIRLGISRALDEYSSNLRPLLRKAGLLTRDSRRVERKKPGQKKARKQYQWVKR